MSLIVGASAAVRCKMAVFDRLEEEAGSGRLGDLSVLYAWDGATTAGEKLIYGGGTRFQQDDEVAERGVLRREIVLVSAYVRVTKRPPTNVREADLDAAAIGDLIGMVFFQDPDLAGDLTWLGINSGATDYSQTGTETVVVHMFQLQIGARLTWVQT
jgi:hypothetical protein